MDRPSGDQKGCEASSVPGMVEALLPPISCIQIMYLFAGSAYATMASILPSRESAKSLAANGTELLKYIAGRFCRARAHQVPPPAASSKSSVPETNQPPRVHAFDGASERARAASCEPDSETHFSSLAKSLALCHLSSTAFARHFLMACSKAGGVMGLIVVNGRGSFSRMAEATLSWLFPSKARWPVSISYKTAPSEKMSLRPSTSLPSTCSGDMYWKVMTTVPSCVIGDGRAAT